MNDETKAALKQATVEELLDELGERYRVCVFSGVHHEPKIANTPTKTIYFKGAFFELIGLSMLTVKDVESRYLSRNAELKAEDAAHKISLEMRLADEAEVTS